MTVLLTEPEAAIRLRISARTLRSIRGRGEIAYVRMGMRKVLYRAADCDAYVASCVQPDPPTQPTHCRMARSQSDVIIPFSQRNG